MTASIIPDIHFTYQYTESAPRWQLAFPPNIGGAPALFCTDCHINEKVRKTVPDFFICQKVGVCPIT